MAEWKQGLFGCFNNCGLCVMAYFCPCIVWGRTAEKVGDSCALCGLGILVSPCNIWALWSVRQKVMASKGIEGETMKEVLKLLYCSFCIFIQTAAEVSDDVAPAQQAMARD